MRKIITFLLLLLIPFLSCEKRDNYICATCVEKITGETDEYCGDPAVVHCWAENMIVDGIPYGKQWECKYE